VGVTTEKLPGSLVQLDIEVDQDRLDSAMAKAVNRISQQVRIPGFRPGKAPRNVVERHVGSGMILQEALDKLVPDIYQEAVEAESIDVIDQPEIELTSTEPLVVRATVPVRPEVELGDYQSIRAPKPEVDVTDEEREDALTELRRRFAMLEPVDRAIEWGDTIRADVKVEIEGEEAPHEEQDAEFALREGGVVLLPGFAEELIGRERGGPQEFEATLPDDLPESLAGKQASYTVTVHEVKQEILPDADDEFAVSLDDGFDTLDELKERINSDLTAHKEQQVSNDYHNEIVDLLVAGATVEFPDVLIERDIDRLIDIESNHASHTEEGLQQWLTATGQTLDELRERLRGAAEANVRRALVLGELAAAEAIEVDDERVSEEIDTLVAGMAGGDAAPEEQLAAVRGLVDTPEGRASIENRLLTQLTLERLEEIASQPEEEGGAEPARGRRRGRRRRSGDDADADAEEPEASADEAVSEAGADEPESSDDP
jgi:trigger factor